MMSYKRLWEEMSHRAKMLEEELLKLHEAYHKLYETLLNEHGTDFTDIREYCEFCTEEEKV